MYKRSGGPLQAKLLTTFLLVGMISSATCVETNHENPFKEYVASVPILQTPLSFSYYEGYPALVPISALDSDLVWRFTPPHMWLRGRLFPERQFVSLMYSYPGDVICFSIFTYTQNGIPIDTAFITGEYMVDASLEARSTTRILENGFISIDDTVETVKLNANDYPIPGTETSKYRAVRLRLDDSGNFVRVDSTGGIPSH